MSERIQAIRGMNDILPDQTPYWQMLERRLIDCLRQYGYQEIRFPVIESTQLFKRSIGEVTDIVEKEMYTFKDLNGDSLTLRPEGTAGCLRACLEHGLLHNQQPKLWYLGSMYRHEKPQKGRYRQFTQCGIEAFGIAGASVELEMLALSRRLWRVLGIESNLTLEINTLGTLKERQVFRQNLQDFLKKNTALLDEDSIRRLDKNPLRILDSKNPAIQALLQDAPRLMDCLGEESRQHFAQVCAGLTALGQAYTINPSLVRGLDYYGQTVFEWVALQSGAQATVCAGGRYDALVEQLGGKPTAAVGMAMGLERIILLMQQLECMPVVLEPFTVFIISSTPDALTRALALSEQLRTAQPQWRILTHLAGGSFKSQFKKADKSGADFAVILGEEEMKTHQISVKNLRNQEEQVTMPDFEWVTYLQAKAGV